MFDVGPFEIITIVVVALLIFGPDKLPKLAADMARMLREVRKMASGARQELQESLGPELGDLNLQELNPATFVKRNLLDPIDEEVKDVKKSVAGLDGGAKPRRPADNNTSDADQGQAAPPPSFDADTT
ncbi:MAG TPA: sec-independent translocase [Actinomycetes bacterium]|nr:sec-independent translocase [Actinomycetes bacterium]